ncbi:hypothetical protein PanWU01x14_331690 [Parasponia andersonii]|uniref:Uncharacterized protein n=1 Tax=Parasponia andersonii TaxID=3476 RepID=A0A2P5AHI4_PARAD|nr:hypothetical protein PanWU01x14_331690 [Parasponia andersonii]
MQNVAVAVKFNKLPMPESASPRFCKFTKEPHHDAIDDNVIILVTSGRLELKLPCKLTIHMENEIENFDICSS